MYCSGGRRISTHQRARAAAKAVIVKLDGKMVMCVLPASHYVNFPLLKTAFGARETSLTPEEEYKVFPDCEPGSEPPFGNLYGMDVLVSRALAQNREISFNACSFSELIRLSFDDYVRVVNPTIMDFSVQQTERRKAA